MNKCITWSLGLRSTPKVPPNMDRHLCLVTLRDGTHFSEMHLFASNIQEPHEENTGPLGLSEALRISRGFPAIWSRGFQL